MNGVHVVPHVTVIVRFGNSSDRAAYQCSCGQASTEMPESIARRNAETHVREWREYYEAMQVNNAT